MKSETTRAPHAGRALKVARGTSGAAADRCLQTNAAVATAAPPSSHGAADDTTLVSGSADANVTITQPSAAPSSSAPPRSTVRAVAGQVRSATSGRGAVSSRTTKAAASAYVRRAAGLVAYTSPTTGRNSLPSSTSSRSAAGLASVAASEATARTARTAPAMSGSPGEGGRGRSARAPRVRPVAAIAPARASPAAQLSQKIARQSAIASTAAPYSGPSTLPSSWTAPTMPSGTPRRRGGQRSATSASVAGTRPPPPTPWRNRPATIGTRPSAAAVTTEPTANSTSEPTSTGRRPRRSAMRPTNGSTAT